MRDGKTLSPFADLFRAVAGDAVAGGHGAVEGGNAAAVGVAIRLPQLGIDAGFEALGDEVLQALGLIVQLVYFVVEHAIEEGLDQAVVPDDFECSAATGGRQAPPAMPLAFDQWVLRGSQLLQHIGDGSGRYLEAGGQRGAPYTPALRSPQSKNGL